MRASLLNIMLFFLVLFAVPTYAATIHGTVYDLSLEPIDAFVEINSVPKQFFVAVNGEYEFNVNPGQYVLKANTSEGAAVELIEIVEEGDYIIDIVIGLNIEDPIEFIDDTEVTDITAGINGLDKDDSKTNFNPVILGLVIIVIIALLIIVLFISKNGKNSKNKKSLEFVASDVKGESEVSDIEIKAITLIREHSRITQKEIRKMLPYSEAKVSLVIAQLESEGKIKKIKKGRGNILVYIKG